MARCRSRGRGSSRSRRQAAVSSNIVLELVRASGSIAAAAAAKQQSPKTYNVKCRTLSTLPTMPTVPAVPAALYVRPSVCPSLVTGQMRLFYFTFAYFLACFNYCGAVSTFFKLSAFDVHGWALHCVYIEVLGCWWWRQRRRRRRRRGRWRSYSSPCALCVRLWFVAWLSPKRPPQRPKGQASGRVDGWTGGRAGGQVLGGNGSLARSLGWPRL